MSNVFLDELKALLLGEEDWHFLWETVLRTTIMFFVILISLRLMGKRTIKQLSVFELVVIIGLGSAAGDPMFYNSVGLLPVIIVFIIVVGLYNLLTYYIGKNKKLEKIIEGEPVCLVKNGAFSIENFKKELLSEDEFFSELRLKGVSQLGQVKEAFIESSGGISVFYFPDEDVKYGLPIMPDSLHHSHQKISDNDHYSCAFCGYTEKLKPASKHTCPTCKKLKWIKSSNQKRIT